MNNQIFDSFERTEFSDEIFAIFGRVLTVCTRFDASSKTLARLSLFKISVLAKHRLDDDEYKEMVQKISDKYKNLSDAINSLKFDKDIKPILDDAITSRNELIHEATLGAIEGFDHMKSTDLSKLINNVEELVLKVIKGEAIISTIISIQNKEAVSGYQFSKLYEDKYLNWVMER
jgi:hypothetical protein